MWYRSKQIHHAVWTSRELRLYLLVAVIFFLTASGLTAKAQDINDDPQHSQPAAPPLNDAFGSSQILSGSQGTVTGTNIEATKEAGEPNHVGNVGGHSVWYSWTANIFSLGMTFTLRSPTTNYDSLIAVYTGTQVSALIPIAANDDYGATPGNGTTSTAFFPTVPGTTYRIAVDGYDGMDGSFALSWDINRMHLRNSRFAGTGISSVTIFRPSTGTWWTTSTTGLQAFTFGTNGDVPTPADFDGDLVTDYAVFRNGVWYVLRSHTSTYAVISWGLAGDKPMPGDYNANGYDDYAVFRPSNGTWYVRDAVYPVAFSQPFGLNTDKPAAKDYDGDGKLDFTVFRPGTGVWYILNSYNQTVTSVNWGVSEDIPMPSEFGADGKADIAVWRPSNGTWYVRHSNGVIRIQPFGLAGDIPQGLDYGNFVGQSDFAVFRPSTGTWYVLDYSNAQFWAFQFGLAGDIPASTSYPIQQ